MFIVKIGFQFKKIKKVISILLATYNGERFISESIDSILNQTFNEWELLIGLNGTTDGTREILKNYSDPRIMVFDYGNDKGKAKTLNKLLTEAKYDWIGLQDDDDIWIERKLESQIKFTDKYDVIGGMISYIGEFGNYRGRPNLSLNHGEIIRRSLNGDNQIANTSAILKKEAAISIGGWKEDLDGIEDFDLWLRLMRSDKRFINVPDMVVLHRLHSNSNFNTKEYNLDKILKDAN
jgi:glycosyltransferase involved in cell wall biosynthesis